ncbi:hypothetical protein R7V75_00860 [Mesomycoplasma ovipneumoniae]|uniref:Uncharacterized protein n=1 Tax=Mesomycoplasma ovipneumoniae TaxID=29562 RepID=A0AAJ2UC99_9BACT|nr:hypothetical protein [Mesomycoplasma ovipneumoniae]MDW2892493.1 hypothetical protein [Mesomycoplasma ovipneumoniae]MDW2908278.1 hypothetical protein [Mesomycoplasma ovipneumoniae]
MKAITLLFNYLFFNSVIKFIIFITLALEIGFLIFTTSNGDLFINYSTPSSQIVILGFITPLSILFSHFWIRYVVFINKYKKEAINLTNNQFEEKYEKLSLKPRRFTIFNMIIRDMKDYPNEIEFNKEKKYFLFQVHYRFFILQMIFMFISFISLPILTVFVEIWPIKTTYFSIHFTAYALSLITIIISQVFLHKISVLLIKNTIEAVYNKYKTSIAWYFMPKVYIKP